MATIQFAKTREAARIIAREEGVTWQDMGKDAPKGERWAVVFPEIKDLVERAKATEMNVPTAEDKKLIDELTAAFAELDIKQAELPRPASIVRNVNEEYKDRKGATIPVLVKRRVAI